MYSKTWRPAVIRFWLSPRVCKRGDIAKWKAFCSYLTTVKESRENRMEKAHKETVMWLHGCPLTVLSRTLSLLGENADDAALTKSSKRISYCCWLYYLNTKLEGAELKLLMPFCAKKITMGRLWRSSQSKQWQRAQAGKKMERTLCNEGQEVMYQVMMEPFHLFFINACRPNCCDQNVRFGRRASFGPNGADVTHGISAANPVLLVTA